MSFHSIHVMQDRFNMCGVSPRKWICVIMRNCAQHVLCIYVGIERYREIFQSFCPYLSFQIKFWWQKNQVKYF